MPPSLQIHPVAKRYAAWVSRHPFAILGVAFLAFVLGVVLVSRLELKTAFHELLPSKDPGVMALLRSQKRTGDLSLLAIGIRSPDKDANLKYAEALTSKLRKLPIDISELATYNVLDLKAFFEANQWLYLKTDDLEEIRDRLRKEITKKKNPLLIDLSDPEEDAAEEKALKARIESERGSLSDRFPGGYFMSEDGKYVWVVALPPGGMFVERAGEALLAETKGIIAAMDPKGFHPQMTVEPGGPIVTAIASRRAVERDIVWVTVTCLVVVAISIGVYFRSLRSAPLIGVPAVLGTVLAFGVAELAFGYLNASTAFLGSIILGNGINYGIILLSRYEEERAHGHSHIDALAASLAGVLKGTLTAAVCASAAYLSLVLTSFRGFSQFGVMGASGVLFCWSCTFLVLPALLVLVDRWSPRTLSHRAPWSMQPVGRALSRWATPLLVISVVVTVIGAWGATHFLNAPFEYNFRKLAANIDQTQNQKEFSSSLDKLFGRWPQPTIVLADELNEVEPIRKSLWAQDKARHADKPLIGQVVTIYDMLPGTPEVQAEKLELINHIRRLAHDPALEVLTDEERKKLGVVDPPEGLKVLEPTDLPPLAQRPFREADGTVGKVVLFYPVEKGFSVWNGRDLLEMAAITQQIHVKLADGSTKVIETAGHAVVFGAMIRSILKDGPIATGVSLLAVIVLALLIMRPWWAAGASVLSLLLGVLWMLGAAGWGGVAITFLNFIALPITFGIGAEYALNVMARYRDDHDVIAAVVSTGGAVTLCSWTTIVGYGSLLAARNEALRGFGAMAILGEVACLLAAIVALPSLFVVLSRRRKTPAAPLH
ncbi:MAG: MMPL family transporter [Deltaproteobacteria bacterium]|nr:MMPL family transporter [Deltaproteobacteria bacterium]